MRPQREDLVDRRKMEARQRVESKHTNRSIAFLCPGLNQQSVFEHRDVIKIFVHLMDINSNNSDAVITIWCP